MTADEPLPPDPAEGLIDPVGQPLRPSRNPCPRCGAPPSKRVASGGFGVPYPICSVCGYEFTGVVWVQP